MHLVFCSLAQDEPDVSYVTNNDRVDILAKPLKDGSMAISFVNMSEEEKGAYSVTVEQLVKMLGHKMVNKDLFVNAGEYRVVDLWTGEVSVNTTGNFGVEKLQACGNVTVRVTPMC